ncbi:unnamed protein product [Ixodes persulcatus]
MLALDGRLILAEKKRNGSSSKLLGPCFPVVEMAEPVWGTTVSRRGVLRSEDWSALGKLLIPGCWSCRCGLLLFSGGTPSLLFWGTPKLAGPYSGALRVYFGALRTVLVLRVVRKKRFRQLPPLAEFPVSPAVAPLC